MSCTWHDRSMVMNHHTASSTVAPTVIRPWFCRIAALCLPIASAIAPALVKLDRHAAEVVVKRMIVVEGADILGDRRERAPERRKGAPVGRMGMGGGDRVRPRGVDARMNDEGGGVDRIVALDDGALVVAADQVRDLDLAEMDAERIDPERVRKLRIARGDVPRDPLVEAEFREQPESRRQPLLAMQPLVREIVEFRRRRQFPISAAGSAGALVSLA